MQTSAQRFRPVPVKQRAILGLWLPPELAPLALAATFPRVLTRPTTNRMTP